VTEEEPHNGEDDEKFAIELRVSSRTAWFVLWFILWLLPAVPIVIWAVVFVGPFIDPRVYPFTRFPRFLLCWIGAVLLSRYWLPDAWHYRRNDKGGLAFVLVLIGLCVWNGVMLLTGVDME
jgi:hypothetical protein